MRLHRGLQKLRGVLPAGFFSGLGFLVLGQPGLTRVRARVLERGARHPLASGAGAAGAGAGFGALIMSRKVVVSLAAAALLAAGLTLGEDYGARAEVQEVRGDEAARLVGPAENEARDPDALALTPPEETVERHAVAQVAAPPTEDASFGPKEPPGASLSGRVVDRDGRPEAGAEVRAWNSDRNDGEPDLTTRADENGRFTVEGLRSRFVITARSADMAPSRGLRGELQPGAAVSGLELVVVRAVTMRGRVLDPSGQPVAGALVEALNGLGSHSELDVTSVAGVTTFYAGRGSAESVEDGSFAIPGLPIGGRTLRAKRAPYLIYRERHDEAGGIEIRLDMGMQLTGRVYAADGGPAVGARVRPWPFWGNVNTGEMFVETDADGGFLLPSIARPNEWDETEYAVAVLHEGHALHVVQPVYPSDDGGDPVYIRLEPERVIAGKLVDIDGAPVTGATVWIEGEREMNPGYTHTRRSTWEWSLDRDETQTDDAGAFRFDRLYPGRFMVHAEWPGETDLSIEAEIVAGDEDVRLVLDRELARKVVLAGRVVDKRTGEPVREFSVVPWIGDTGMTHRFESEDGEFELAGLPPTEIKVAVRAPGFAETVIAARRYQLGEHALDVALTPARSLSLVVRKPEGEPFGSGRVHVRNAAGEKVTLHTGNLGRSYASLRDGRVHLHGLPAEAVTLALSLPPFEDREVVVDLTEPIEGDYELIFDARDPVSIALVLYQGEVEESELARRWKAVPTDPESRAWIFERFQDGRLSFPSDAVSVEIRNASDLIVATASFQPRDDGDYDVSTSYRDAAGHYQGMSGATPSADAGVEVPAGPISLLVKPKGRQAILRELDYTGQGGSERFVPIRIPD